MWDIPYCTKTSDVTPHEQLFWIILFKHSSLNEFSSKYAWLLLMILIGSSVWSIFMALASRLHSKQVDEEDGRILGRLSSIRTSRTNPCFMLSWTIGKYLFLKVFTSQKFKGFLQISHTLLSNTPSFRFHWNYFNMFNFLE